LIFAGRRADTGRVPWVELVVAIVLLPLAGYALIAAWKAGGWLNEARRKDPPPEPIERIAADLRRLRAELEDTETRAGLTAKHHRVRAVRGAYLDALGAACRRLEVTPPAGGDGAPLAEIYRVEAELRRRGVDVRSGARPDGGQGPGLGPDRDRPETAVR
jgi:hypothetical protein